MRHIWWGTRQHGRGGLTQSAMGGIDIALWDIVGKKLKMPLYKLFGAYTDKLVPYASAGFYQDDKGAKELADDVAGYIDNGYKFAKIKCARTPEAFLSPTSYMPSSDYCTYTMEKDPPSLFTSSENDIAVDKLLLKYFRHLSARQTK